MNAAFNSLHAERTEWKNQCAALIVAIQCNACFADKWKIPLTNNKNVIASLRKESVSLARNIHGKKLSTKLDAALANACKCLRPTKGISQMPRTMTGCLRRNL